METRREKKKTILIRMSPLSRFKQQEFIHDIGMVYKKWNSVLPGGLNIQLAFDPAVDNLVCKEPDAAENGGINVWQKESCNTGKMDEDEKKSKKTDPDKDYAKRAKHLSWFALAFSVLASVLVILMELLD